MKVLVLNGSPKGEYSITIQTVLYLKELYSEHEFEILNVGQKIRAFEKNFTEASSKIMSADCLLFSYPVYTFLVPAQLHRFIELMKENNINVSGKYFTQITTSKHFYDVTAHRFISDNCVDMGMKYVRGLSSDMTDLLTEKGRKEAAAFWDHFVFYVQNGFSEQDFLSINKDSFIPVPVTRPEELETCEKAGDVVIVTDLSPDDNQLKTMIERFRIKLPYATRVVNIHEFVFHGGCLGCFKCAATGKCVYKDGFDSYLRNNIQTGDAIIYAFSIKDHSMGSIFKMYDDRQFCNGHRTVTMGRPAGYIISGKFSTEINLQMVIEGRIQVGGNVPVGIATDEKDPDKEIDMLAANVAYALEHKYSQPSNFYGVGGMKIFRDLIYEMRGMMRADHKFFKKHGQYDFPQKRKSNTIKMYLVGALMKSSKIQAKMGNKMNEGMIMPYRNVLNIVRKNKEKPQ